jgi:hypothetical protein
MFFVLLRKISIMKPKKVPESFKEVDYKLVEIGRKVRQLRRAKNPNYEDFAAENNINKVTLNRIERGDSVSTRLFFNVLNKLGIASLEDFFREL